MIVIASPERPLSASDLRITSMRVGVSCRSRDEVPGCAAMQEDCPSEAVGLVALLPIGGAVDTSFELSAMEQ